MLDCKRGPSTNDELEEPIVAIEELEEPIVAIEELEEPIVTVEELEEPIVTVEELEEPIVAIEELEEPTDETIILFHVVKLYGYTTKTVEPDDRVT